MNPIEEVQMELELEALAEKYGFELKYTMVFHRNYSAEGSPVATAPGTALWTVYDSEGHPTEDRHVMFLRKK